MHLPNSARDLIEAGTPAHPGILGPEVQSPLMDEPLPGFVNRIQVERISGVGPWTGRAV